MVAFSLSAIVSTSFGLDSYSSSNIWTFGNSSYFTFNQSVNFTDIPTKGVTNDSSLIGYWNFNEGSGTIAHDASGNGNNGTITGATFVNGKYGTALSFNGTVNYVNLGQYPEFAMQAATFAVWVNPILENSTYRDFIAQGYDFNLGIGTDNRIYFSAIDSNGHQTYVANPSVTTNNTWIHVVAVVRAGGLGWTSQLWINGAKVDERTYSNFNGIRPPTGNTYISTRDSVDSPAKGIIDEVRIYNRTLSASEVSALYVQPDPLSLSSYYNYKDPVTNNTMLIHVDSLDAKQ